MKTEIIYGLEDLPEIVKKLSEELKGCSIIALTGELGAGKTTFVKQLLARWGVQDEVLSPTFTYVNCYQNQAGLRFFHFDLYRIEKINQFFSLGFDEYLGESGSVCIIEWPAVINSLLQGPGVANLQIKHIVGGRRRMVIEK